jgi:hypothetical protein
MFIVEALQRDSNGIGVGLYSKRASPEWHRCVEDWQRPLSSSSTIVRMDPAHSLLLDGPKMRTARSVQLVWVNAIHGRLHHRRR